MGKPGAKNVSTPARRSNRARGTALLGGAAGSALFALIITLFLASGLSQVILRSSSVASVVATVLVDLANGDRAQNDRPALTVSPVLTAAAQAKADDMATKGYFAHTSPQGLDPWHWFAKAGYRFTNAGENLAVDFSDSADVERAWMNSPTHRDNILNPKFTEVGIATAVGTYKGRSAVFVVQMFGTPARSARQGAVRSALVPEDPARPALAQAPARKNTEVLGAEAEAPGGAPLWAYAVGFPRTALQMSYYILGIMVTLMLAWSVRYEMEKHHLRHARAAAGLLLLMGILLMAANAFFFSEPVITALAASF